MLITLYSVYNSSFVYLTDKSIGLHDKLAFGCYLLTSKPKKVDNSRIPDDN